MVVDDGIYECEQDTCFVEDSSIGTGMNGWDGCDTLVQSLLTQTEKDAGWGSEWREGWNAQASGPALGRCLVRNWNIFGDSEMDPTTYESIYRNATHVNRDKVELQSPVVR